MILHLITLVNSSGKSGSSLADFQHVCMHTFLLACTGLSWARQIFGESIHCHVGRHDVPQVFVDAYCLINGTVTMDRPPPLHHDYYQWVSVYLLMLAFSFRIPYLVWSRYCGFYIEELCGDQTDRILETIRRSKGYSLFYRTWALEGSYAVLLAVQVYATDLFFNRVWSRSHFSWRAVAKMFPDTGKCEWNYYSGGGLTEGKFVCLLPLNSAYRKIFFVLYGAFVVLILWNMLGIVQRLIRVVVGRDRVNVEWSLTIAKSNARTWEAKEKIEKYWKRMRSDDGFKNREREDCAENRV